MVDNEDASEAEMQSFCAAVGELVLWASAIDGQLAKAVIRTCTLTETPFLEPIVAELSAYIKLDIVQARIKHIKPVTWSTGIKTWLKSVEKVNSYRNIVAHHQVTTNSDGELSLFSPQARRILRSIDNSRPTPAKTIKNINDWVVEAKAAFGRGENVLSNLDQFAEQVAKRNGKKTQ